MTRRELIKMTGLSLSTLAVLPGRTFANLKDMTDTKIFEVIIIGGSYAGLSAAMSLGRSLRSVLIIDSGSPCNKQSPQAHNFITQDGKAPQQVTLKAKAEVLSYKTVRILEDKAIRAKMIDKGFLIETSSGQQFTARKIIFATGIKDVLPPLKGLSECWGVSVVHCPYCHGYEIRDKVTGILANGEKAFQLAAMVNNLTADLSILTNGKATLSKEQLGLMDKHGINIIETKIVSIEHEKGQIRNVIFEDGTRKNYKALYAGVPFIQHSDIPGSLGCEVIESGHLKIDEAHKTTVRGVYACGDNSSMTRSIAHAVFAGNLTGAMVNKDLTIESF